MNRDEFVLKVLIADANEIVAGSRKRRWVVGHSSRSQKRDFMVACDGCNERIEPFLEFGRDEILSIFGAVDHVDVILGIGMAHVPQTATQDNRFGAAPPALGSSCGISQPFRAGLMFGYRPSGPGFGLPSGDVGYLSLNPTGLGPICGPLPVIT